jgi:hypothetical protein
MFSARRADIADRSYSWQNSNHSARILSVGEVRIMVMKEFNGHELLFRDLWRPQTVQGSATRLTMTGRPTQDAFGFSVPGPDAFNAGAKYLLAATAEHLQRAPFKSFGLSRENGSQVPTYMIERTSLSHLWLHERIAL